MKTGSIGRFEQSFVFHMIRDFFLILIAVAGVELASATRLVYDFRSAEPARVDRAATQLANDVKSIMLNSGGPTAAQTVYPILDRNYDDLGLSIAVRAVGGHHRVDEGLARHGGRRACRRAGRRARTSRPASR